MFQIGRRAPASISRCLRTTPFSTSISSTRVLLPQLHSSAHSARTIPTRLFHAVSRIQQEAVAERFSSHEDGPESQHESRPTGPITKFEELKQYKLVDRRVVDEITHNMKLHTMTEVQTATINQALQGSDIVAQAKTGTGKTLGFLIPTIQNILKNNPELANRKRYSRARATDVKAIIISPTRELAEQIAVEAEKVCRSTDLRVQVAVGGNSKRFMLQKTRREGCHLLVATPGRLNDILQDETSGVDAPGLTTLVLDEADRLLDSGFSREIQDIMSLLPSRQDVDRQTLLFSATMPREVMHLVRTTLKPEFHFVQTVKEGELATHDKVPQKIVTTRGVENFMPALFELAKREVEAAALSESSGQDSKPFKAIVYFESTANVELSYQIFDNLTPGGRRASGRSPLWPTEILEIHGQLTQQQRSSVSERFRRAKSAILFSTDVTARGMDFPNVTHVVQVGIPSNREQYIHRLGRTGRADKGGEGWIIVQQREIPAARRMLTRLPIHPDTSLQSAQIDMSQDAQLPAEVAEALTQIGQATQMVSRSTKSAAYDSALAQASRGHDSRGAISALNRWATFGMGLEELPQISPGRAAKLRLSGNSDLNIGTSRYGGDESDFGRGRDRNDQYGSGRSFEGRGRGGSAGGYGDRGGRYGRSGGGDRRERQFESSF